MIKKIFLLFFSFSILLLSACSSGSGGSTSGGTPSSPVSALEESKYIIATASVTFGSDSTSPSHIRPLIIQGSVQDSSFLLYEGEPSFDYNSRVTQNSGTAVRIQFRYAQAYQPFITGIRIDAVSSGLTNVDQPLISTPLFLSSLENTNLFRLTPTGTALIRYSGPILEPIEGIQDFIFQVNLNRLLAGEYEANVEFQLIAELDQSELRKNIVSRLSNFTRALVPPLSTATLNSTTITSPGNYSEYFMTVSGDQQIYSYRTFVSSELRESSLVTRTATNTDALNYSRRFEGIYQFKHRDISISTPSSDPLVFIQTTVGGINSASFNWNVSFSFYGTTLRANFNQTLTAVTYATTTATSFTTNDVVSAPILDSSGTQWGRMDISLGLFRFRIYDHSGRLLTLP